MELAPCRERVTATSPRPAVYVPSSPITSVPSQHTYHINVCTHTHGLQLLDISELLRHPAPSRTSVDWLGARTNKLPHHTTSSLSWKQGKEGSRRCLIVPSEFSPTGREMEQTTPTTWPEDLRGRHGWVGLKTPASSTSHAQGYPMSGKRMVWVLCHCVVSLAIPLFP